MPGQYQRLDGKKSRKCTICLVFLLIIAVVLALVITVFATSLHVDTITASSSTSSLVQVTLPDGQIGYQSIVQRGDQLTLKATYTAQLGFMSSVHWKMPNETIQKGDTLFLTAHSYNSTLVECQAVYHIFGLVIRSSKSITYVMMNDTSANYVFYQDNVVHVPAACLAACNVASLQVTLSVSGSQCGYLQSISNGTSLLLGDNDTFPLCGGSGLQHLVTGITTVDGALQIELQANAAPLSEILQDASFLNVSMFASLAGSTLNNTTPPTVGDTSSLVLHQLAMLRANLHERPERDVPSSFNLVMPFSSGDHSYTPMTGVGVAFSASGTLSLNAAISLKSSNGQLKVYQVNWNPVVDVTFLGVIYAQIAASHDFDFTLFEAEIPATTVLGVFCRPFFAIKLEVDFEFDGVFTTNIIAPLEMRGSFSVDYNTDGDYWENAEFPSLPTIIDKGINITTSFGGCQGSISVSAGPEIGLSFLPFLLDASVSLQRKIKFGWQSQNPPPYQPTGSNPGGPDVHPLSNAFCNNVGCWCPSTTCPAGAIIPSLSGGYYSNGWAFDFSLSFFFDIFNLVDYKSGWVSDFYTIGPQMCSPRPLACAAVLPQRCPDPYCPVNNICSASDCFACPQPGLANCGTPADHSTANAIWCAQTYANGGVPYTRPPVCFTGGNTCVVRCCGGYDWNMCYFSESSTAHLC